MQLCFNLDYFLELFFIRKIWSLNILFSNGATPLSYEEEHKNVSKEKLIASPPDNDIRYDNIYYISLRHYANKPTKESLRPTPQQILKSGVCGGLPQSSNYVLNTDLPGSSEAPQWGSSDGPQKSMSGTQMIKNNTIFHLKNIILWAV